MEEQKYLIAIALAEQNNKRLMPLGGKTYSGVDSENQVPTEEAKKILLDLLLRLFKRTSEGNIKISNNETGLLIAKISFESMQKKVPIIKSNWINTGDTDTLIGKLISSCSNLWSIKYKKHEGILYKKLKIKD